MKDTVHHTVHPSVHLHACAGARITRAYRSRGTQFGRGQNRVLGWNDPTFWAFEPPKKDRGVVPAHEILRLPAYLCGFAIETRQERRGQVKNVRITDAPATVPPSSPDIRISPMLKGLSQSGGRKSLHQTAGSGDSERFALCTSDGLWELAACVRLP